MNSKQPLSTLTRSLGGAAFALATIAAPLAQAQTVWTGSLITYTQPAAHNPALAADQDRLTSNVWLTRGSRLPMFNKAKENGYDFSTSPADTEWAFGELADYASLDFQPWPALIGGGGDGPGSPSAMVGQQMVLHLKTDNIYLSILFTDWGHSVGGGYSYMRSTPAQVLPPPVVSLTNPAPNAVFAAPANLKLGANATVSSGTVTNVTFYNNTTPLGSALVSPFVITANSLAAGTYNLTAVATAAGISTTSTVVTVTVVSPVATSLAASKIAGGQFTFSYAVNPGLSYVVQQSTNLINWVSVATNVPASSPASFTNNVIPNSTLFYRVGRLPNP